METHRQDREVRTATEGRTDTEHVHGHPEEEEYVRVHPRESAPEPDREHATREPRVVGPAPAGLAIRLGLSLSGAAAMAMGAFLEWVRPGSVVGVDLEFAAFYRTGLSSGVALLESAGLVALVLAGLTVLGFVDRWGWLQRLAGALALIAFGLFALTVYRTAGVSLPADVGIGAWLLPVGGLLVVTGGFFGTRVRATAVA